MKKLLVLLILLTISVSSFAGFLDTGIDYQAALTTYRPIYFITGFIEQEQIKVQLSMKYDLFYPYHMGLYFAYTQLMFWDLYSASGPFNEINFSPEIFWRFESGKNFLGDISILFLDHFQIGAEHLSNGKDEDKSRGWSRFYGEIQLSAGKILNIGINYKYFRYFEFDSGACADIAEYTGSMTTKVFMKLIDKNTHQDLEEIYFSFGFGGGVNGLDFNAGWQEIGLKSRTVFSRFRPFIHLYRGYGESLINFDRTKEDLEIPGGIAIKLGLILE